MSDPKSLAKYSGENGFPFVPILKSAQRKRLAGTCPLDSAFDIKSNKMTVCAIGGSAVVTECAVAKYLCVVTTVFHSGYLHKIT